MARILSAFLLLTFCLLAQARNLESEYEKASLLLGKKNIHAYVADDDHKRAQGLMFIESLPKDTGMIFVFETSKHLSFWMKDTLIPLSIGFFDEKGVLIDVQEMPVNQSLVAKVAPSYSSKGESVFALEMEKGWFAKHKIKLGTRLTLTSNVKSGLLTAKLKAK